MGGHAGGDVASAIAAKRVAEADGAYALGATTPSSPCSPALIAANSLLAETVFEHSELTGMGTTVSGILRVGDQLAIAHIGDSRIYRFRDGELKQITADHTFVQRLVDSGRITPEEAAVHPRRSVLMRVLGDVDASPEIDTAIFDAAAGRPLAALLRRAQRATSPTRRWPQILGTVRTAQGAADRLVKESLDHGAPDNVTVVLVDIDDSDGASRHPADLRRLGRGPAELRERHRAAPDPAADPAAASAQGDRRPTTATSSRRARATSTS